MTAEPTLRPASGIDGVVERLGRWTAARTTRRSFLGKLGRAGVLVAGGASMATLLADQADARVCGQSGVAPRCDTFTCNATWGWCWYASGCCADGALKKICDCCAPNTPHPVGYCPSGTRVLCIVESCGADPRLMTRPVHLVDHDSPIVVSVRASRIRHESSRIAVIGDADDHALAAVAASVAPVAGGPVLLVGRGGVPDLVGEELSRLGVGFVTIVGAHLPETIDEELRERGLHVERVGTSTDPSTFTAEVAAWSRPLTGVRMAVVIMRDALHSVAAAAALAGTRRMPLLIGEGPAVEEALRQPRGVRRTFVVSVDASAAERFPGGEAVVGDEPVALSAELAGLAVGFGGGDLPLALASRGADSAASAAALAGLGGPLLLHHPGTLDGLHDWLLGRRHALSDALVAGNRSRFPAQTEYDLQAVLNEFETHLLTGSAGQGLPVIPQPREERPIGRARR